MHERQSIPFEKVLDATVVSVGSGKAVFVSYKATGKNQKNKTLKKCLVCKACNFCKKGREALRKKRLKSSVSLLSARFDSNLNLAMNAPQKPGAKPHFFFGPLRGHR